MEHILDVSVVRMESSNLHIHRVLCTYCHKTHVLFPTSLVSHKSIPLFIQCEIVDTEDPQELDSIMSRFQISLQQIHRIKEAFTRFWKSRFPDYWNYSHYDLVLLSVQNFSQQFLQSYSEDHIFLPT